MTNKLPIGIFDSGLGGLTVVKELIKILPHENFIYLGDTARVPYGTRSVEIIKKFSLEDSKFLLRKKVKCIVIACNTSSAVAGEFLKSEINLPVFDVIKPVNSLKKSGKVGVIGTRATIGSDAYKADYAYACPLFVPFIEEGITKGTALKEIAKEYLRVFKGKNIKSLILGCTHYPIIGKLIQSTIGANVELINPAKYVIIDVKNYLIKNNLLNNQKHGGKRQYFITDLNDRFVNVADMFLGEKIKPDLKKGIL